MNVSDDTTYTFKPFTTKVEKLMRSISDKIATRTAVPTAQEIGFVNTVSEPVYRMLSIGNAVKGCGQADALIGKYRDVIAADYAYTFLDRYFRVGMAALEKDFGLNTEQKAKAREVRDRVQGYLHSSRRRSRPTTARWPASTPLPPTSSSSSGNCAPACRST